MNKDTKIFLKQQKLDYVNLDLYIQALTHPSFENENKLNKGNYQRLEFVGDAVIEYIITNYIYSSFSSMREGEMTLLRIFLVRMETLYELAKRINLDEYILLGNGEEKNKGRDSKSLVSDCFEAFCAAIYLDLGIEKCSEFVMKNMLSYIDTIGIDNIILGLKDPKTRLQEFVAADTKRTVTYKLISQTGPANKPEFVVHVLNDDLLLGIGKGSNKQEAEQNAASDALKKMVI